MVGGSVFYNLAISEDGGITGGNEAGDHCN